MLVADTSFVAIHVSTCDAINEDDNVLHLVDSSGCIIDSDIMENVDYTTSGDLMAKTKSQMFKFLEGKRFRFSGRIEACEQHQPYCLGKREFTQHYPPDATDLNERNIIGKMLRAVVDKDDSRNDHATESQYEHLFFASTSRLDPRVPKDFKRKLEESSVNSPHDGKVEDHHDDINHHNANLMNTTVKQKSLRVHHDGIGGMTNDLQETEGLDLSTIRSADFFFNKAVITEETDFYNHSTLNSDKENKSAMAIENALPLTKFSQQIRPENGNNATDEEGEYRVDKTSLHDENATITSFGVESSISYKSDGDDAQVGGTSITSNPKNESELTVASTSNDGYNYGSTESSPALFFAGVANATARNLLHKISAQISPHLKKHQFNPKSHLLTTQSYENRTAVNSYLKETTAVEERKTEPSRSVIKNNSTTEQQPRASTVIPITNSMQNSLPEHGHTISNDTGPGAEVSNLQSRANVTTAGNTTQITSYWLRQPPLISDNKQKPYVDFKDVVTVETATNGHSEVTLGEHDSSQSTAVVRLVSSEVSDTEHNWLKSGSDNEHLSPTDSLTTKRNGAESDELDDEQPFLRTEPDLFSVTNFVQHTTKAMAAVPLEPPQEIEQVLEHFRLQAVPVLNSSQPAASAKLTTGKESDQTNISQTKDLFGEAIRKRANANISDSQHNADIFDEVTRLLANTANGLYGTICFCGGRLVRLSFGLYYSDFDFTTATPGAMRFSKVLRQDIPSISGRIVTLTYTA
uniref:ZP domain-containing protein n=1 Tax=Parascaris univalens TaxID=6257 RepID=A0A914ZLZ6_PARUN